MFGAHGLMLQVEQVRRMVLEVPAPIMLLADDGEVVLVNRAWEEASGYSLEDIPTVSEWTERAYGVRVDNVRDVIEALYSSDERGPEHEHVVRAANGEVRTWDVTSGPLGETADGRKLIAVVAHDVTERRAAEAGARAAEKRLQAVLDNAPYGAHMYELRADDRLVLVGYNRKAAERTGTDYASLVGLTLEEAFPGDVGTELPEQYRRVAREGGSWENPQYVYDWAGMTGIFDLMVFQFGPRRVCSFFRDVSEERLAERALARSARALKALSGVNEALVRAHTEAELLEAVCSAIVNEAGYAMAWVGFAVDDETKSVVPVYCAGEDSEFSREFTFSWGEGPLGQGPTGQAIRQMQPVALHDLLTHPRYAPAAQRGFRSVASLPLAGLDGKAVGVLCILSKDDSSFRDDEMDLLGEMAEDLSFGLETLRVRARHDEMERDLVRTNARLEGLLYDIIVAMGKVVEARDQYTQGHETGVARLARAIATEMGLPDEQVEAVEIAALVHDIGKLSVPTEILTKPGRLSDVEFALMKQHPENGSEILKGIDFGSPIAEIVLQHHERMDGSGYPRGLSGDAILIEARVIAVADVIEAMASHRPYRPAIGLEQAMDEIVGHPEKYDVAVMAACRSLRARGEIAL